MNFPKRAHGRPAATVGLKPALSAEVLTVEERGADDAQSDWFGEITMAIHVRVEESAIERRAR